ncbi:MAG: hypothetical protein QM776_00465 [Rhodocyclaceae bacterium]
MDVFARKKNELGSGLAGWKSGGSLPFESGAILFKGAGPVPERKGDFVVAETGSSISEILGTSDPQAVGNFMRVNGLTSSTIVAGQIYVKPYDRYTLGDASKTGQAALNADNSRISLRAASAASNGTAGNGVASSPDAVGDTWRMLSQLLHAAPTPTESTISTLSKGVTGFKTSAACYLEPSSGSVQADQGYWSAVSNILGSDSSVAEKAKVLSGVTKYYFKGSETAQGTVQVVSGVIEVSGAVTLSSTGVGTVVGVPLAFHGGDQIGTGFNRIFSGEAQNSVTYQATEYLTGSPKIAAVVDKAIPFVAGVAALGQGLRVAEDQLLSQTVYRGVTPADRVALDSGLGMTAKAPNGTWTAEQHVLNYAPGTRGGAALNDPWIGTSWSYDVASGYNSGSGLVAVNLAKVPSASVEVWQGLARSQNYVESMAYHRSIWAQEVSIYQAIPAGAVYTPLAPLAQISVWKPVLSGSGLAAAGTTTQQRSDDVRAD